MCLAIDFLYYFFLQYITLYTDFPNYINKKMITDIHTLL